MQEKISIIVPVYNVEAYLERCVESILKQTYSNLEILLVNDGSTDKSGELCDQLALRDQRIRVIHKENGGLSDARNRGIDEASSDLIGFIDSDDYIDKDMYETVRYLANLSPKLDGIKLHLLHILKNTRLEREYREKPFKILSLDEYTEILINCLRILPESVVIHRMTGDGDKRLLVEPLWSGDKKRVLNTINKAIREAKR